MTPRRPNRSFGESLPRSDCVVATFCVVAIASSPSHPRPGVNRTLQWSSIIAHHTGAGGDEDHMLYSRTGFQLTLARLTDGASPHNFHGATSVTRYGFRHASHEEAIQARAAVRTENDEVGIPYLGLAKNDVSRVTFLD